MCILFLINVLYTRVHVCTGSEGSDSAGTECEQLSGSLRDECPSLLLHRGPAEPRLQDHLQGQRGREALCRPAGQGLTGELQEEIEGNPCR